MARTMQTSSKSTAQRVPRKQLIAQARPYRLILENYTKSNSPPSHKTKPIKKQSKRQPAKQPPKAKIAPRCAEKNITHNQLPTKTKIKRIEDNTKDCQQKVNIANKSKQINTKVKKDLLIEHTASTRISFLEKKRQDNRTMRSTITSKSYPKQKTTSTSNHKKLKKQKKFSAKSIDTKKSKSHISKTPPKTPKKTITIKGVKKLKNAKLNKIKNKEKHKQLEPTQEKTQYLLQKHAKTARNIRLKAREQLKESNQVYKNSSIKKFHESQNEEQKDELLNQIVSADNTQTILESRNLLKNALAQYQTNQSKAQQQIQQHTIQLQKSAETRLQRLFLIQIQRTNNSWTFKTMNKRKQLFTTLISLQCSCSCSYSGIGCQHLHYIIVNIAKCPKVFEQLQQKSEISQVAYFRLNMCLKIALHCRTVLQKRPQLETSSQTCYICMQDIGKRSDQQTENCTSCSRLFHKNCVNFWRSLEKQLCPLCNQTFCSQPAPQLNHIEEIDEICEINRPE